MFNWKSFFKLLLVTFLFIFGFLLWVFFGAMMVEFGSTYKDIAGAIFGISLCILWFVFARWFLKP